MGPVGKLRTFLSYPHCRESLDLRPGKTYLIMGTSKDIHRDDQHQTYVCSLSECACVWRVHSLIILPPSKLFHCFLNYVCLFRTLVYVLLLLLIIVIKCTVFCGNVIFQRVTDTWPHDDPMYFSLSSPQISVCAR